MCGLRHDEINEGKEERKSETCTFFPPRAAAVDCGQWPTYDAEWRRKLSGRVKVTSLG